MTFLVGGSPPFVIARGTDRAVGNAERIDQFVVAARMADSNGPRLAVWVASSEIEIAARIDRKILEGSKLTRSEIDRQPLGHGPKI